MARKPRAEFEITAEDKTAAGLRQAEKNLQAVAGSMKTVAATAAIGAGALTAAGAVVMKMANDLDRLAKSAQAAGVGVEVFQAWEFAATQSGVAAEQFASGLIRANRAIGQVAAGTGPAVDLFQRLQISVRDVDGNVRTTESVVRDFATALGDLKTPAERAAAASALFGRSAGPKMALLLRDGEAGLQAFEDQARRLGLVISEDATTAAEQFGDRMDQLQRVITAATANAIFKNADAVEALAEALAKVVDVSVNGAGAVVKFVQWLGEELAARVNGVALNDIPRLTGAISDAQAKLEELESGGGLVNFAGESVKTQIANTRAEIERLTVALENARQAEAKRRDAEFLARSDAPQLAEPAPAAVEIPKALRDASDRRFEQLIKEEEQLLALQRDLKIRGAQELNAAVLEEESRLWDERRAIEAGFASIEAEEAFNREAELFALRMEARARQFEEELAVELGFKSARDQAIQEQEESHQEALIRARYKGNEMAQRAVLAARKFEEAQGAQKINVLLGQAAQLTAGLSTNSRAIFNVNKALSLASAIMNTSEGITEALSRQDYAGAAFIAAAGAAQIATISSTQFGGASSGYTGGGPGSGIPSMSNEMFVPAQVSADRNNSTITLEIVASDSDIARVLMKNVRAVADDEDVIIASGRSRQALEFTS